MDTSVLEQEYYNYYNCKADDNCYIDLGSTIML